ncbi:HD domain-containing protein [Xylanibacillus composti]|uniref:C-di-GMP phosphodiesterase n=1 Tax=Xylanibacillus composti TaxID=1572762 RepID=A0A8J4H426_9BACL|nr:HD domain-containing phosphohydrolase [Xylanibacillus composti]MDT9725853.1 HD domain-containing protein [Xylanibacillus composti]GIQ69191.1 c-di-GMP phosphodiesterase [Xylanibacillus composti]
MRYVHVEDIEPGQILGRSIFSANGNVLLSENIELTVYMINTLRRIGVEMLYIKDEQYADVEIEEVISEETKRKMTKKLGEMFDSIRSGKSFSDRSLSVGIDGLLEEIMANQDVLVQLSDIRTEDNRQYLHALNVCMMSVMTGMNLGLNAQQLKELAIGALLHDVGKVGIQPEHDDPSTRNHHTWRGFDIIKREQSLVVAHIALQHHEALDGSGSPRGLEEGEIHLYAKIVAVANMYDNLLFEEQNGRPLMPHEACERLMALSGTKLDRDVLIEFLRIVSIYPTGISVRLSTKETGVVVGQHRGLPGRPVIRVVKQDRDESMEVKEVDLAKQPTVFIEGVLS